MELVEALLREIAASRMWGHMRSMHIIAIVTLTICVVFAGTLITALSAAAPGTINLHTLLALSESDAPTWTSPSPIDPSGGGLTSIECPSATFCMAVDANGNALSWNGTSWSPPTQVDKSGGLSSVSCPSATFCMAVDNAGNALSWDGSTWSAPKQVDSTYVSSVACPSATFCMAVDNSGNALQFNGSSWSSTSIASGQSLSSISCPITVFCMAASTSGSAITYTSGNASNGGSAGWSTPQNIGSASEMYVSCRPSYSCVAVSSSGNATVYNGVSWSSPVSMDSSNPTSLSCGSTELCVAVDAAGNAIYYHAPGAPVLTSVSPSSGSVSGGTAVNIYGSGFSSIEDVRFGSSPASSFNVVSPTQIQAITPAVASPQNVAISISDTNATSTTEMTCGDSFSYGTPPPSVSPKSYVPISPIRIADTRPSSGKPYTGDTLLPCGTLNVQVSGIGGIPSGAVGLVANVTVVSPSSPGYLSIYPADSIRGIFSNINFIPGQVVANLVEVPLNPSNGQITIYNGSNGAANVVVDVEGYIPSSSSGSLYTPITPLRICDTRTGNPSGLSGIEAQCNSKEPQANSSFGIDVAGVGDIASNATAVALTVTAVEPQSAGYISVYPSGSFPGTSNLNFTTGDTIANSVVVPLSSAGQLEIYVSATTNVLVDISGYYSSSGSMVDVASPVRICDTRSGSGEPYAGDTLGSSSVLQLKVAGVGGIPDTATAVVINVTVTNTTAISYLTAYPAGSTQPVASNLNWQPGATLADLVVVKIGSSGMVNIYNHAGSTDVIVDVEGWY